MLPNLIKFPGKIHLITNDKELAAVSELILGATELGFDTEKLIHVVQSAEITNYKAGPYVNK